MTYINLSKITILLSILFIIPPIAHANINNEAIKMNKERILKEINANYTERNINHYIELDNDLEFISVFEEESKQANYTVNQLQIVSILEKTLKKINVGLKLKYDSSFQFNILGNNNHSITPTTEVYNIILTNDENQILGEAKIAITISQLQDIKEAYLQTQQRFIYFFDASDSSPFCYFEKIDNLGSYAVEYTRKEGDFMWLYKNMMVQISRNNIPELSLKIANMFQEEVEHELKKLHE
ncbi:hypothetical protein DKK76_11505 [Frischella perrara]|uniref:Uncharacterized protein n=1 Tax=Frischella perrara TaxID=1267021 RepID=A0A318N060_FRIPE|nr:hypothetical protein [Frischella perrara]PXY94005.1 hypothetical protein DKK76_11505 [Frischella perrara]